MVLFLDWLASFYFKRWKRQMYYQRVVSAIHKFLFASIFWVGWTRVFIPSWWWSRVMCMVHQKLITIKKIHTGFPMWFKFSILINITELNDSIINVQNCSFISTCKFNSPFSYCFKRLEMHFFICILFCKVLHVYQIQYIFDSCKI